MHPDLSWPARTILRSSHRRRFLGRSAAAMALLLDPWSRYASASHLSPLEQRLAQWEDFGWHWTGSNTEQPSVEWLAEQASASGMRCELQTYPMQQTLIQACWVQSAEHRSIGLPLFNHAATPPEGLQGRLIDVTDDAPSGALQGASGAAIALLSLPPQARVEDALAQALPRRANTHWVGAVIVTTGAAPGLAPLDCSTTPMPLPVIQVASDALPWLRQAARLAGPVTVMARMTQEAAIGHNVIAARAGADQNAAPIVIATDFSGWGPCTGERGGAISTWLQIASAIGQGELQRGVIMLAASGAELGGLGRAAFLRRFDELAPHAVGWLELGANLGARQSVLQVDGHASRWSELLGRRLTLEGVSFQSRATLASEIPARAAIGLALRGSPAPAFHLPTDQLPSAIDLRTLSAIGAAVSKTVSEWAASPDALTPGG